MSKTIHLSKEFVLELLNTHCFANLPEDTDFELLGDEEKDKRVVQLKGKIAELEKALELACERVKYFEEMQDKEMGFNEFFGYDSDYDLQAIIEQYKEQAKEMMKSE